MLGEFNPSVLAQGAGTIAVLWVQLRTMKTKIESLEKDIERLRMVIISRFGGVS